MVTPSTKFSRSRSHKLQRNWKRSKKRHSPVQTWFDSEMKTASPPKLARTHFITDGDDPVELWRNCFDRQVNWEEQLSSNEELAGTMKKYAKQRALNFVWLSNQLEDTLPKGSVTQHQAYEVLAEVYDSFDGEKGSELAYENLKNVSQGVKNGSRAIQQLSQHLLAYKEVCQKSIGEKHLSEEVVKETHRIMMQDLKNESGDEIHPGEYRRIEVHAGTHVFPSHECVPSNMSKIVEEYNKRSSKPHDAFQLASWLHHNVVSLHPFEDGNGRLSRLLSCYSLMRDGLPFPVTQTSDHKRSQKHLVWCLERDRRPLVTDQPHLTTLTVVSVDRAWNNFFTNLEFELPEWSHTLTH